MGAYIIPMSAEQRTFLSLLTTVAYTDMEGQRLVSDLCKLRKSLDDNNLVLEGEWYNSTRQRDSKGKAAYEERKITVPQEDIRIRKADVDFLLPGILEMVRDERNLKASDWSEKTGMSEPKVRRIASDLCGLTDIILERFRNNEGMPVKRYRYGIAEEVWDRLCKALLFDEPFHGSYEEEDKLVLKWMYEETRKLAKKYANNGAWRPTFHPTDVAKHIDQSVEKTRESMRRMTGLLCKVRKKAPRVHVHHKKYMNVWMLPPKHDNLALEVLGDSYEEPKEKVALQMELNF